MNGITLSLFSWACCIRSRSDGLVPGFFWFYWCLNSKYSENLGRSSVSTVYPPSLRNTARVCWLNNHHSTTRRTSGRENSRNLLPSARLLTGVSFNMRVAPALLRMSLISFHNTDKSSLEDSILVCCLLCVVCISAPVEAGWMWAG